MANHHERQAACAVRAARAAGAMLRAAFHDRAASGRSIDPCAEKEIQQILGREFPEYGTGARNSDW